VNISTGSIEAQTNLNYFVKLQNFSAVDLMRVVQGKRQIAIGAEPLPLRPAHVVLIALVPASRARLQELKMEIEFCDNGIKAVRAVLPC